MEKEFEMEDSLGARMPLAAGKQRVRTLWPPLKDHGKDESLCDQTNPLSTHAGACTCGIQFRKIDNQLLDESCGHESFLLAPFALVSSCTTASVPVLSFS